VTQQNAALVEEAAAAAASMQEQAATLADVVSVFKLDRAHDLAPPAALIKAAPVRPALPRATAPKVSVKPAKAAKQTVEADWEEF
jgi:methyl-accepting chemotaxis protein